MAPFLPIAVYDFQVATTSVRITIRDAPFRFSDRLYSPGFPKTFPPVTPWEHSSLPPTPETFSFDTPLDGGTSTLKGGMEQLRHSHYYDFPTVPGRTVHPAKPDPVLPFRPEASPCHSQPLLSPSPFPTSAQIFGNSHPRLTTLVHPVTPCIIAARFQASNLGKISLHFPRCSHAFRGVPTLPEMSSFRGI